MPALGDWMLNKPVTDPALLEWAYDLKTVPEEKIILAELRETQRQAEEQLDKSSGWNMSCPTSEAAMKKLTELTERLAEGYSEIEQAAADKVALSRKTLSYWREIAAETLEHLSIVEELQPCAAA